MGDSVIVLPGVKIGAHSIIGAGSVVTHNIPESTVAAGNPARVVMTQKEYLIKIKTLSADKKIFGEDYFIRRLDETKRKEIQDSVRGSIGFIV